MTKKNGFAFFLGKTITHKSHQKSLTFFNGFPITTELEITSLRGAFECKISFSNQFLCCSPSIWNAHFSNQLLYCSLLIWNARWWGVAKSWLKKSKDDSTDLTKWRLVFFLILIVIERCGIMPINLWFGIAQTVPQRMGPVIGLQAPSCSNLSSRLWAQKTKN